MEKSDQMTLWVLRAQCDDREAVELLLRHIQPALRRYLIGLVKPFDTDDVLQEVLVLIYRKLGWLRDPELFQPWAFRIASRAGFHHLKKRRRLPEHVPAEPLVDDLPATGTPVDTDRIHELLITSRMPPA